jgi:hypothetical protein
MLIFASRADDEDIIFYALLFSANLNNLLVVAMSYFRYFNLIGYYQFRNALSAKKLIIILQF